MGTLKKLSCVDGNYSNNMVEVATPKQAAEWAPVLPKVTKVSATQSEIGSDILTVFKDVVTIRVQNVTDIALGTLGEITRLSDEQVAKYPALLNRFEPQAILETDAVFAIAIRDGKVIASVYGIRSDDNGERQLHVGNLNSDGSERGIALPLVAALFLGDAHFSGKAPNGEGVARILPNGDVNIGSTRVFARLGFYASRFFTHPLTLRNPQKGLEASIEPEGSELSYLQLSGVATIIETHAIGALAGYNVRFGEKLKD